jgi:hypothetical protein
VVVFLLLVGGNGYLGQVEWEVCHVATPWPVLSLHSPLVPLLGGLKGWQASHVKMAADDQADKDYRIYSNARDYGFLKAGSWILDQAMDDKADAHSAHADTRIALGTIITAYVNVPLIASLLIIAPKPAGALVAVVGDTISVFLAAKAVF